MTEAAFSGADQGTVPELRMAETWADFTRALAIFPETNQRVQDKCAEMLALLAEGLRRLEDDPDHVQGSGVRIIFREEKVLCGEAEMIPVEGSSLAWLRSRLDRCALAGVEFLPGLEKKVVHEFTRTLLRNYVGGDAERSFESLWPQGFDGLILVDRRFEGFFGGPKKEREYGEGVASADAGSDATVKFLEDLLANPRVTERIAKLHSVTLEEIEEEEEERKASELLRRIVDEIPAEALENRDALLTYVCRALDALHERAAPSGPRWLEIAPDMETDDPDERFVELMREVSRRYFGRGGPTVERLHANEEVERTPGGGRARDAEIGDDLDALLEETDDLPAELGCDLDATDPEAAAEEVATLLYYLTHLERPSEVRGLDTLLTRRLRHPAPEDIELLRAHIADDGTSTNTAVPPREAIVDFLQRARLTTIVRECGLLEPKSVIESFPLHFVLYLETLDLNSPRDLETLDEVCLMVGARRMWAAEEELLPEIRRLDSSRLKGLFNHPDAARLALAGIVLRARPRVALRPCWSFLRGVDLPQEEAFLLFTLPEAQYYTPEYLGTLIDLHFNRVSARVVHSAIAQVLVGHIEALQQVGVTDKSRLDSIRNLAKYPSDRGRAMLKELSKRRWNPFAKGEPAVVRRLARETTKLYTAA